MAENKAVGERVSMYGMLELGKNPYTAIIIPKIQRDYAQGRKGKELLRERFLNCIFESIESERADTPDLVLDFVYGSRDKEGKFYPVDGQQRLTTLFLLGMYLGKRTGRSDKEMEFLRCFSYETRDSSLQFCRKLHDIAQDHWKGIRGWIELQWWYNGEWRQDPTITSMLNMLDDIDKHYCAPDIPVSVWDRYKNHILFDLINLADLETTDSLYIKMNSRGKPLTDFEHFKAELEEFVRKFDVMPQDELSRLIDTTWTEMLWNYRNIDNDFEVGEKDTDPDYTQNGLDNCFTNLFKWYLTVEGVKRGLFNPNTAPKDIIKLAQEVLNDKIRCKKIILRVVYVMNRLYDIWEAHNRSFEPFFKRFIAVEWPEWTFDPNTTIVPPIVKVVLSHSWSLDLFEVLCHEKLSNEEQIYMEAFFEMLDKNIPDYLFIDRLRVVRNLTENSRINPTDFKDAYLKTDEIIAKGFISKNIAEGFNEHQRNQETLKINWLAINPHYANLLKMVENHRYFLGNISCIIDGDHIDVVSLKRFGSLFRNYDYDSLLRNERMLLSFGDYAGQNGDIRSYAGWVDGRWKDIINSFSNLNTFKVIRKALNATSLFDETTLERICDKAIRQAQHDSIFTWEYYLLSYPGMRHNDRHTQSKYRYKQHRYTYEMLGANGGGRSERIWNPFNFTVAEILKSESIDAEVDEAYGPITMTRSGITADIQENDILFTYPDSWSFRHPIPQNGDGFDIADRIRYCVGACKRVQS